MREREQRETKHSFEFSIFSPILLIYAFVFNPIKTNGNYTTDNINIWIYRMGNYHIVKEKKI